MDAMLFFLEIRTYGHLLLLLLFSWKFGHMDTSGNLNGARHKFNASKHNKNASFRNAGRRRTEKEEEEEEDKFDPTCNSLGYDEDAMLIFVEKLGNMDNPVTDTL